MAGEDGKTARALDLFRRVQGAPHEYDFFQLLRLLECVYRELPRMGEARFPEQEPIRLGQEPSLAFPPSALGSFEPGKDGRPWRLLALFFGLFGPNGPMPVHLTDYVRDRQRNAKDSTLARFADIFHHRMLALFYRAWANAQPTVSFDRPESDRFSEYVGSAFGIGAAHLRNRDAMRDVLKLHFAGRLSCQTRHPEGLEAILSAFFQMPALVEEFVGHWLAVPEPLQTRFGSGRRSEQLGIGSIAGARVWDRQYLFRVVMGPMSLAKYQRLLPGGECLPQLVAIVRNYAGDELQWDVNLILQKEDVPEIQLGVIGRLGWTTWLVSRAPATDADDLCLDPIPYFQ